MFEIVDARWLAADIKRPKLDNLAVCALDGMHIDRWVWNDNTENDWPFTENRQSQLYCNEGPTSLLDFDNLRKRVTSHFELLRP